MKKLKNLEHRILEWFGLYPDDEVEKIVDYWTMQHREASAKIDELNKMIERMNAENLAMLSYDPSKVIRAFGNTLKLGEYEMTAQEAKALKEDAAFLKQSQIWGVMQNTLTELARQNMFEESKDFCDMHKGKATLYDLRAMRNILEQILNARPN